jgi:hypothetical protein
MATQAETPNVADAVAGAQQGVFTDRLVFQFDRVQPGQPVRMTLITRTVTPRMKVLGLFRNPVCRVEERAPNVFDGRMPTDRLESLSDQAAIFRRIDLSGLIFGLPVPTDDAKAQVVIALEEPLTGEQRQQLRSRGVLIRRQGFASVSGETTGGALAELALLPWIGPIQVKRVILAGAMPGM